MEEGDASLRETAVRELTEEFLGVRPPPLSSLLLLNTRITKAIKGNQYKMHTFIAFDEEGWWDDDMVCQINANLALKKQQFEDRLGDGSYWQLTEEEKRVFSPEVRLVSWIELREAIDIMASSLMSPIVHTNDWQRDEFLKHGVTKRDPMYQTMTVLQEIAELGSVDAIKSRAHVFENDIYQCMS